MSFGRVKSCLHFWLSGHLLLLILVVQGPLCADGSWEFPVCTLTLAEGRGAAVLPRCAGPGSGPWVSAREDTVQVPQSLEVLC